MLPFKKKGFGIVAVVMLLLFISIAAVAIFPSILPQRSQEASKETMDKLALLEVAITRFTADHAGTPPTTLDDLVTSSGPTCAAEQDEISSQYRKLQGWCGPYVDRLISQNPDDFKRDGWGNDFQWTPSTLKSCGPNLSCGDADDITRSL